jgi:DNA invertase Pin-like site-specific DNA recombinase
MTAAHPKPRPAALAFSYVRFSTPEQIRGDSLRRQTQATAEWCARNGVRLDTSLTLRDLGKSAFKGAHRSDKAALGAFLKLVEEGKVPKGSYLVIENLDRLSREEERTALRLWLDILDAGVSIVQLHPETVFRHERSDMTDIIRAIIELSRGHSESRAKSFRNGAAWVKKRQYVREHKGGLLTHKLPAWVEERDGKLYAVPTKAAAVQRIFQLAAQGFGAERVVRELVAERVPPIVGTVSSPGRGKRPGVWLRSYVTLLLNDRRVVGEFQPRSKGKPDGEPIRDYFPAIVSEDEWQRARAGVAARRVKGYKGRRAYDKGNGFVNLFTGLLRDARDGGSPYNVTVNTPGRQGTARRILRNLSVQGRARSYSFPYETFERAILAALREIDPTEIIHGAERPDERLAIAAELERVAAQVSRIKDNILAGGDVGALADVLRQLEAKRCELTEREQAARRREAFPLEEAWRQTHDLLQAMEGAEDAHDFRLRLRAVLRREIDSIWVLVVPRGQDRLAAVQLFFKGGCRREYLQFHRPPRANGSGRTPGYWQARSARYDQPFFHELSPEQQQAFWEWADERGLNPSCPPGGLCLLAGDLRDPDGAQWNEDSLAGLLDTPETLPVVFSGCESHPVP